MRPRVSQHGMALYLHLHHSQSQPQSSPTFTFFGRVLPLPGLPLIPTAMVDWRREGERHATLSFSIEAKVATDTDMGIGNIQGSERVKGHWTSSSSL